MKANTVKNDMVEASSEAELRTSERGMGLGIDVVGGGEAVVTLKTRAGWHFANGASEQTVYKSRGATVLSLPLVGDNSGAESGGQVPVGETEDPPKDEDPPSEDLPKEHDAPRLALSFDTKNGPATAVARSVLDTEGYMTFTVTLNAEVVEKGIHDKDGDALEFSPTKYHWSWGEKGEKDGANSCETDDASVTVTVRLSKKSDVIDRKVTFSVYGSGCEHCREEVSTEKCSIEHTVRVYVLSIERKDYLGVNRTDEYWATGNDGKYVKRSAQTATLKITPEPKGCTVQWEPVGENYEFTDKYAAVDQGKKVQSQKYVEYQNKTPDSCSSAYLGDMLAAKVSILGMKDDVSCSTNFTIVKVDAKIGDVSEDLEEKQGIAIAHSYSDFREKKLRGEKKKVLTVTVEPKLPPNETFMVSPVGVALRPEGTAYDANGAKIRRPKSFDKAMTFATGGSSTFTFGVWGLWCDGKMNNCNVSVEHVNWSDRSCPAKDRVSLTCYSFKLITPAGDPDKDPNDGPDGKDGQNEFTYKDKDSNYDNKGVLRVYMKAVLEPAVKGTFKGAFYVPSVGEVSPVWKKITGSGCRVTSKGEVTADENGVFEAVALFVGYPKENGSFGRKTASFTLDGVTKKADYEVFFPKGGTNHPACAGCPNCPNWFYYWRQGACKMEDYVFYGGSKKNMYGEAFVGKLSFYKKVAAALGADEADDILKPGQLVALYDLAAGDEEEIPISTPGWAIGDKEMSKKYADFKVGGLRGGLACCAAIVAHEQHHVDMFNEFKKLADADKDQVADVCEDSYDRIPTKTDERDTYEVSNAIDPIYAAYGDNEVRARKIEREEASYDKTQDWANPGFQCKNLFGYDWVKKEDVK